MSTKALRICLFAGALLLCSVLCRADTIGPITQSSSFSGTFAADNDQQIFSFELTGFNLGATISIQTSSYAAGGFAPELTLFDNAGIFPAQSAGGSLDVVISPGTLSTGIWTIVLTQAGNDPLGNSLRCDVGQDPSTCGFSQDADHFNDSQFTLVNAGDPALCGDHSPDPLNPIPCFFFDSASLSFRTGDWALIVDVQPVNPVPEPPQSLLMLTGCAIGAMASIRRK